MLTGGSLFSCNVLARLHFLGLRSKISQKRDLCKAESLQVETGEKGSGCQFTLWKEGEIKQVHVYSMPSISFILNQLKIWLEGAFKAGDVCGMARRKSPCVAGLQGKKLHEALSHKKPILFLAVLHLWDSKHFLVVTRSQTLITISLQEGKQPCWLESVRAMVANLQQSGEGSRPPA